MVIKLTNEAVLVCSRVSNVGLIVIPSVLGSEAKQIMAKGNAASAYSVPAKTVITGYDKAASPTNIGKPTKTAYRAET